MTIQDASLIEKWAADEHPEGVLVAVRPDIMALRALANGAAKAKRHVVTYRPPSQWQRAVGERWGRVAIADGQPWPESEMISLLFLDTHRKKTLKEYLEAFLPYLAPGGQVVIQDYFQRKCLHPVVHHYFPRLEKEPAQIAGDTLAIQPVAPIASHESPVHLTVVMAAANRDLRLPLECLREQRLQVPVIIVDGGGNTFPEEYEKFWFRIPADPGRKFHEARLKNVGLLATVSTHIVFINADILLPPGHLSWLLAQFREKPHILFTVPLMDVDEDTSRQWREAGKVNWEYEGTPRYGAYGDHVACESAFLKTLGGWDEEFIAQGVLDDHLCIRWMAGGRLIMSGPPVFHLHHPARPHYMDEWRIYRYKFEPLNPICNWERPWGRAVPQPEERAWFEDRLAWFEQVKAELNPEELKEGDWETWSVSIK